MTNMLIEILWLTYLIENLLVLEFQVIIIYIVGSFSYKAHFRPQISSNDFLNEPLMGAPIPGSTSASNSSMDLCFWEHSCERPCYCTFELDVF